MGRISRDDLERLSAYLDGELSPEERSTLESRLSSEPYLRRRLKELRRVRDLLRSLPRVRPSQEFLVDTTSKLQKHPTLEKEPTLRKEPTQFLAATPAEKPANMADLVLCCPILDTYSEEFRPFGGPEEITQKTRQSVEGSRRAAAGGQSAIWKQAVKRILRPRTILWPAVAVGVAILISLIPTARVERARFRERNLALKHERTFNTRAMPLTETPRIDGSAEGDSQIATSTSLGAPGSTVAAPELSQAQELKSEAGWLREQGRVEERYGQLPESPQMQGDSRLQGVFGSPEPGRGGGMPAFSRSLIVPQEVPPASGGDLRADEVDRDDSIPNNLQVATSVILEVSANQLARQQTHLMELALRSGLKVLPPVEEARDRQSEPERGHFLEAPGSPQFNREEFADAPERQSLARKPPEPTGRESPARGEGVILRFWGEEEEIKRFVSSLAGQGSALRPRNILLGDDLRDTPLGEWLVTEVARGKGFVEKSIQGQKVEVTAEQTQRRGQAGARFNVQALRNSSPGREMVQIPQAEAGPTAASPGLYRRAVPQDKAGMESQSVPLPSTGSRYVIEIHLVPASEAATQTTE
jgi:hypothetical protein